ncbi:hypothetical protein C1H76_2477 [Elsinoe australis]|uniref:Uncharacterized protein n=1 Tax=Elsinoe australis TaxID=40998 RepID=A0A4U7BAH7_9PEZI|nr:hypothetical protein C1H76_2477 [Elsinoe australis]
MHGAKFWLSPPQRAWMILALVVAIVLNIVLWGSRMIRGGERRANGPPIDALIPMGIIDFTFLISILASIHGFHKRNIGSLIWLTYNVLLSIYWTALFVLGYRGSWVGQNTVGGAIMGVSNVLLVFCVLRVYVVPKKSKYLQRRAAVNVEQEHYMLDQEPGELRRPSSAHLAGSACSSAESEQSDPERPDYSETESDPPPAYSELPETITEASLRAVEVARRAAIHPISQLSNRRVLTI